MTRLPKFTRATCPYCGVGCVLDVGVQDGKMVSVHAREETAPNFGMMCPKGATLFKSDSVQRRLLHPMVRDSKSSPLRATTWDEALQRVADALKHAIQMRGPAGVAWYGSGQLDTESTYLFTKLFKGFLKSNQTESNSRLCMSSAVTGYLHSFGSDAPPTCYDDIELADTFFILGANMTANHPVLFNRIRRRRATSESCRIIVVDPRRSKTAEFADIHLAVKPGGDVALLRLLAKRLHQKDVLADSFIENHTEAWPALRSLLVELDETAMMEAAGIDAEQIDQVASLMASRKLLSFHCVGANQSTQGTAKNTAINDLHLMLGQVGHPGCGPFSLTGQPNAMGGRESGYLSYQLPGYRFVANPDHRKQVEQAWKLPSGSIDSVAGRSAIEMFEAAADGEIETLWIACTNPAVSMPDLNVAQKALCKTPCVIVQDCFHDSETAQYADILLPAATWGEKTGTMTNSERFVTRSFPAVGSPGESKSDWEIVCMVAQRMGFHGFDFGASEQVWDEFRQLTGGTWCDMNGITNDRLLNGGVHWPCPDENGSPVLRRYTDMQFATPSGRARFSTAQFIPPAEPVDDEYPLILMTGRVAAHWHSRARTQNVEELNLQASEPFVSVNPADAGHASLVHGSWVYVTSRRGRAMARVSISNEVPVGVLFAAFHWGDSFDVETAINYVTHGHFDPISKQPELKHAAVRIEPTQNTSDVGSCKHAQHHSN